MQLAVEKVSRYYRPYDRGDVVVFNPTEVSKTTDGLLWRRQVLIVEPDRDYVADISGASVGRPVC
eukprot:37645-Eustigmatos_ZCMA.PRE.1